MGKKEDILNATQSIIANDGIMKATISRILKTSNTGYGTLYNYFDSKEDLYLDLYVQIIKDINTQILKNIEVINDEQKMLEKFIIGYVRYCLSHYDAFKALEILKNIPLICGQVKENSHEGMEFFELIDKCESLGIIKKRSEGYNINLLFSILAMFINHYHQLEHNLGDDLFEDLTSSVLGALK